MTGLLLLLAVLPSIILGYIVYKNDVWLFKKNMIKYLKNFIAWGLKDERKSFTLWKIQRYF